MNATDIIDRRIRFWEAKLAKAEGKYRSDSENMGAQQRVSAANECRRCQTVLICLRGIREELREEQA